MKFTIEIAKDNNDWDQYSEINTELFSKVLDVVLENYPNFKAIKNLELSILLTDNKRIKSLNSEFRGQDKATNVLSFPDLEIDFRNIDKFIPDPDYVYLGDIAFSYSMLEKEAEEKKILFMQHFKHLLVHSILHLLGYDHENDDETETMQEIEVEILKKISIPTPYSIK